MSSLLLDDVHHRFSTAAALTGLSLHVDPGEVVAMIGLNGAGKTTALRALVGRIRPDSGTVRVRGHDPTRLPAQAAAELGHVIDAPLVYPELTVTENATAAARLHGLDALTAGRRARQAVERLDLGPWARARASTLSAGNRQRLGIACATVHEPRVLILDEPTSALDPRGVVIVRELLGALAAAGTAVLVSSHHLDEVSRVATRTVVVHAGRVVGTLDPGGVDLERRFFAMVLDADTHVAFGERP